MAKNAKQFGLLLAVIFIAASCNRSGQIETNVISNQSQEAVAADATVRFFEVNSIFEFSGKIDQDWKVEYIPGNESINIYDPSIEAKNSLEQSQILIRYFKANNFLTLSTVDILSREGTTISGHSAVRYEIKKKAGVANFPNQPSWRSGQHKLIDIRYSQINPSIFYVIAYNPTLDAIIFEDFINSLVFED